MDGRRDVRPVLLGHLRQLVGLRPGDGHRRRHPVRLGLVGVLGVELVPQDVLGENREPDGDYLIPCLQGLEGLQHLLEVGLPPLVDVGYLLGVDPHELNYSRGVSLNQHSYVL